MRTWPVFAEKVTYIITSSEATIAQVYIKDAIHMQLISYSYNVSITLHSHVLMDTHRPVRMHVQYSSI